MIILFIIYTLGLLLLTKVFYLCEYTGNLLVICCICYSLIFFNIMKIKSNKKEDEQ